MYHLSILHSAGLAEVIWSKENAFVTFDFQCSPESQNGTGECGWAFNEFRVFAKQVLSLFSPIGRRARRPDTVTSILFSFARQRTGE